MDGGRKGSDYSGERRKGKEEGDGKSLLLVETEWETIVVKREGGRMGRGKGREGRHCAETNVR